MLRQALRMDELSEEFVQNSAMVGVALLQGWSLVHDVASHEQTWIMMQASKAAHRRRGDMKFWSTRYWQVWR